jgi:predicted alpha/beta superfamily hydrolase
MTRGSSTGVRLLALAVAVVLAFPVAACARGAMVTFKVLVPEDTPPDASVFIAGSISSLGPWDPGKVKLGKIGDLSYAISLMLPAGLEFQYKFTRGSWETVEKGRWFEEIPDREHDVIGDETVMVHVLNWRDYSGEREIYTVVGDLRHHEDFPSTALGNTRCVRVYLPPGYEEGEERRYPVLYMHDGQNIFDAATSFIGVEWGVDETLERMIGEGLVEPLIVVGICSTLPEREHTGVMGSSLGGIASLYIAWTHPDVFSRVGAMSTAYWWSNSQILTMLEEMSPPPGVKVWLDMGTAEDESDQNEDGVPDIIEQHRRARNILMEKDLVIKRHLRYIEDEGAIHNERAWAARFPRAVRFLFPAR